LLAVPLVVQEGERGQKHEKELWQEPGLGEGETKCGGGREKKKKKKGGGGLKWTSRSKNSNGIKHPSKRINEKGTRLNWGQGEGGPGRKRPSIQRGEGCKSVSTSC